VSKSGQPFFAFLIEKKLERRGFSVVYIAAAQSANADQVLRSGPAGREYHPASSCRRNEMIFRTQSSMTDFPGANRRALPRRPRVA
jgi:hypothetical protein